ncbi:MAG: N-acetyl-gamma-glutamyl-phosphate reductase [Alphaproteobacteria bacterium]|jgi:N-acetyl-gamma-glutamyl-phosphate reductase|nr:N-acetyl-gamma-glutamyl-phosphate reductase [Alphaproteobacteria bacterium]MDP6591083.1 N-acetyl-gamma-glutamyl-phosphate reductase [Alphaproteobacteria bacterium]
MTASNDGKLRIGILGASGYTGGELLRLLAGHGGMEVAMLSAERRAGRRLAEVFPHLAVMAAPDLIKLDAFDYSALDAVFCCLPHGTTQDVIAGLPAHLKIVDLSADFRLADPAQYAEWYGHEHRAVELQGEAVYGLSELKRDAIRGARLVANPGCYPTGPQLALAPLLQAGRIAGEDIIIDAKSGVSGAGREPKQGMLFAEVGEGVHAYGVARHRHAPEIEQGLSEAAGAPINVSFTPHLLPMNRGILATIYVRLAAGAKLSDVRQTLERRYADEPFVHVVAEGVSPTTRDVRGSNHCLIGLFADRLAGRAILLTAIDNLVKGASGQALQNMNLMCGFDERTGLEQLPLFP